MIVENRPDKKSTLKMFKGESTIHWMFSPLWTSSARTSTILCTTTTMTSSQGTLAAVAETRTAIWQKQNRMGTHRQKKPTVWVEDRILSSIMWDPFPNAQPTVRNSKSSTTWKTKFTIWRGESGKSRSAFWSWSSSKFLSLSYVREISRKKPSKGVIPLRKSKIKSKQKVALKIKNLNCPYSL